MLVGVNAAGWWLQRPVKVEFGHTEGMLQPILWWGETLLHQSFWAVTEVVAGRKTAGSVTAFALWIYISDSYFICKKLVWSVLLHKDLFLFFIVKATPKSFDVIWRYICLFCSCHLHKTPKIFLDCMINNMNNCIFILFDGTMSHSNYESCSQSCSWCHSRGDWVWKEWIIAENVLECKSYFVSLRHIFLYLSQSKENFEICMERND